MKNTTARALAVWRTITIGKLKDGKVALSALAEAGWEVESFPMRSFLGGMFSIKYRETEEEISLFLGTVADLGFTEETPATQIVDRAQSLGYRTDVHEVVPQLCSEQNESPFAESFLLAMDVKHTKHRDPVFFKVVQNGFEKQIVASYPVPGRDFKWKQTTPILLAK